MSLTIRKAEKNDVKALSGLMTDLSGHPSPLTIC